MLVILPDEFTLIFAVAFTPVVDAPIETNFAL
jgi:hypothetical protein